MHRNFPFIFSFLFSQIVFLSGCNKKKSANEPPTNLPTIEIRTVKEGLNHVWEMEWSADNHIWFTERSGRISKMNPSNGNLVFSTIINEVVSNGEGGLLGMALHPDFLTNGFIYIVYNYNGSSGYREKIVRYTFSNNSLANPFIILENIPAANIHNGSRIRLADDGSGLKLYFTTGDAANASSSQDINSRNGKILRLNPDGTIPADNPFAGNPVWSYGHRNPQGLIFANNRLYASEHGPAIEDEVNIIVKGRNYGWPNVNGPCDGNEMTFCNSNNVIDPIWSSGNSSIAVCGIDFYNNDRITPWKNSILMTTLKDQSLRQLKLNTDGNAVVSTAIFFKNEYGRIRDVCVSPDGRVFIGTSNGNNNDKIIEISKL